VSASPSAATSESHSALMGGAIGALSKGIMTAGQSCDQERFEMCQADVAVISATTLSLFQVCKQIGLVEGPLEVLACWALGAGVAASAKAGCRLLGCAGDLECDSNVCACDSKRLLCGGSSCCVPDIQICSGNACIDCPPGQVTCDGGKTCVRCPEGGICQSDGSCVCPSGQTDCSGKCVDQSSDPNNCGLCLHSCSSDRQCLNGTCSCPPTQPECGGVCCPSGKCESGSCTQCPPGQLFCIDGLCHSGSCDCKPPCPAGQTCHGGTCAPAPPPRDADCVGRCPSGQVCLSGQCSHYTVKGSCYVDSPGGSICFNFIGSDFVKLDSVKAACLSRAPPGATSRWSSSPCRSGSKYGCCASGTPGTGVLICPYRIDNVPPQDFISACDDGAWIPN
jgi:hypothetical protein